VVRLRLLACRFGILSVMTAAEAYLASVTNYETMARRADARTVFRLDRVRGLSERLGSPHEGLRAVHVAGTKGKGSTCAMVDAVLRAAGFRVGLSHRRTCSTSGSEFG